MTIDYGGDQGSVSTPEGKKVRVLCSRCSTETLHSVRASLSRSGFIDGPDINWTEDSEIVQCDGCLAVSFRVAESNSEDFVYNQFTDEVEHPEEVKVYPRRSGKPDLQDHVFELPKPVRDLYREVLHATLEEQRVLVGIGIRALVEAVCKEQGAKGSNLEKRIDDLVPRVLTQDGAEILHGTRLLGNEAAHEAKPLSDESIDAAMEVVEHLLRTTYILPAISAKLPKRK